MKTVPGVTHRSVTVNGVRLHLAELGDGPPLVLLHGFPEHWWTWRYQLEPLAQAGFRVVAPDLRGYHQSERRGPYDLDTLARDVDELLAELGHPQAGLVGHDWGGGLAWHVAATRPQRLARLAIINAPHPAPFQRALRTNPRQMLRSWYMFFFLLPRVAEWFVLRRDAAWLRSLYRTHDPAHFSAEELAPFFEAMAEPGAATAAIDYYRAAVKAGLRRATAFQHAPPIDTPTLLLWGRDDPWMHLDTLLPGTERHARHLEVVPIAQAYHFPHVERADEVNRRLIDFFAPLRTG